MGLRGGGCWVHRDATLAWDCRQGQQWMCQLVQYNDCGSSSTGHADRRRVQPLQAQARVERGQQPNSTRRCAPCNRLLHSIPASRHVTPLPTAPYSDSTACPCRLGLPRQSCGWSAVKPARNCWLQGSARKPPCPPCRWRLPRRRCSGRDAAGGQRTGRSGRRSWWHYRWAVLQASLCTGLGCGAAHRGSS